MNDATHGPSRFPIVGIGASAGGLEAFEGILRRLSSDGMAYVVLQHLAPAHESLLAEILGRSTRLPVVTIQDGAEVAVNTIHVTPPGVQVTLDRGVLHLTPGIDGTPRQTIDIFFRSLAAELGPAAIGVVLSGAGSDATAGLRAIKEAGGITFVQDPSTATQPSMPQSAIDAGCADFSLSPAQIGDELMRLSAHPYVAQKRTGPLLSEDALARVFQRLQRAFRVDFSTYKPGTIERRIERRMALLRLDDVEAYIDYLGNNPDELGVLYSDLLIGVTGFFRDKEPFETLASTVFPRLFGNRVTDVPIRIWVPGCASGEEAYSVAICLAEYLDTRPPGYKVQIFGTDLDEQALVRARHGQYPQNIELDVSPERLQRFFSRQDRGYRVSRQVRDMVVFARHNLGGDPPFSRLDLISCRNVLIYLQPPLQRRVLRIFHYALNSDGFLLLGTSESVGDASDLFSLVDRTHKLYSKKNTLSAGVFDFGHGRRTFGGQPFSGTRRFEAERRPTTTMQQLADRTVIEKFGPPGVIVNEHSDVVQFRGRTGPYLAPSPGAATLNVLKLVRPELLAELRVALQRAASERVPVKSNAIRLGTAETRVVLEVVPLLEPGSDQLGMLILFRDAADDGQPGDAKAPETEPGRSSESWASDLERELLVTKEYLQSTVQELEAANEELQSSNEELQSSNEELQSSNEELETSKEELQSTNEELATVNDELQNRMNQLNQSNDDLQNVLASMSLPFIIVGPDLRVRRFSAHAEKLLSLRVEDIGRPVAYLGTTLGSSELEQVVADAINSVRERAQRVRCSDGRWYTMRVLPYRTSDHSIRGALVEFLSAPIARRIDEPLEIHELVGKVLSTLPHILMLIDEHLRVVWVNKAFFDTFVAGAEILGRPLEELWPSRASLPALWAALDESAARGVAFGDLLVDHPFGRKSDRPMRFRGRAIAAEGDRPPLTLIVMEESEEGRRA